MDITKSKESIRDDEECCELNPWQEIFHDDSSSKQNDATEASDNNDEYNDVTEASDHKKHGEYRDKEDHVMVEKGKQLVESTNSKKPQNNESCTCEETKKRRRNDFKGKIKTLEQMLGCTEQEDVVLSLRTILGKMRVMKNYVESYYRSMGMELPPFQSPYDTPNNMMRAQGESSCNDNFEENNNLVETSNPM